MTEPLSELLDSAHLAAQAASEPILPLYRSGTVAATKGGDSRNLVTEADLAADAAITALLHARHPHHLVLTEESPAPPGALEPSRPTWVVDPVDGTSNFACGLPLFAISIAFYAAGEAQVGLIHAPLLGWTFHATAGGGAWLNGERIRVSQKEALAGVIGATDWPRDPVNRRNAVARHAALSESVHTLRSMGSAALGLAAVAAGWLGLYFNLTLGPWDVAAGALILREAGGRVTALDGSGWDVRCPTILATNGLVHDEALATMRDAP